jgi:hypothetical protein
VGLTFAAPAFLALLAALPFVVWWHVRRMRHRPRPVAALFLWDEARRAASARRRWRPTWSLLLQLAAVAAAALALAQPSLDRRGPPDLVVVLDAGARLAAVDPEGRRLDRARAAVLELADEAGAVALVRAGAVPELALPFTRDRAALRAALDAFQAVDARVDVEAALDLARALETGSVAWVSDDPGPERAGVRRVNVAGSGRNVGIVAFDLGIQQAFVAIASSHPRPVSVGVVLERRDGALLARTDVLVPAGGRATATFPIDVVGEVVVARLELGGAADALDLDDVAFAGRRAARVVLDADEPRLRRAFAAVPGTDVTVTGAAARVAADVRVLTGADPDALAPGDYVVVAPAAADARAGSIADWARTDPLLRFVDLREVAVGLAPAAGAEGGDGPPLPWAATRAQLESAGWRVLAWTAEQRAVLAYRERGAVRVLAFAVHPSQTDLVFRAAFPTLVANLLDGFRGGDRAPLGVVDDAGRRVDVPGLARVGGRDVTVSLLAEDQTRLPLPAPDDRVPEADAPLRVDRPTAVAGWLLAIALAALLVEWVAWVRGPGARARAPRAAPRPR